MSSEPAVLPGTQLSDSHQGGRVRGQADRLRPLQVQVNAKIIQLFLCVDASRCLSSAAGPLESQDIVFYYYYN